MKEPESQAECIQFLNVLGGRCRPLCSSLLNAVQSVAMGNVPSKLRSCVAAQFIRQRRAAVSNSAQHKFWEGVADAHIKIRP